MFCRGCGKGIDSTMNCCPHCGRDVDALSGGTGFWELLGSASPPSSTVETHVTYLPTAHLEGSTNDAAGNSRMRERMSVLVMLAAALVTAIVILTLSHGLGLSNKEEAPEGEGTAASEVEYSAQQNRAQGRPQGQSQEKGIGDGQ